MWYCHKCRCAREPILEHGKPKVRACRSGFIAVWLSCGHVAAVSQDRVR
jgi:hypothetical protein